jgi:ABC-type polysaccharide/polyol phosphate transport system ATPase subunit
MTQHEIIAVRNLSKAYSIYQRKIDILKEAMTGKNHHDIFWALRDINFKMLQKDRIGIIGANGSGKSTLLKIITGHLSATSGTVKVEGNISAMLSLNTVLNLDDTGLENIRFNLILNGCPNNQLNIKTEEIIEFTELGPFIYAPVKTYSSGMNAKLAFAITTAIEPDILVIDEVLSVGDAYFMGKATRRMKELCDRGNGLLFVSHSTSAIQMLCDKVLWMENGSIRMFGVTNDVIKAYEDDYRRQEDQITRLGNAERIASMANSASVEDLINPDVLRLRLVGRNDRSILVDTHYIADISVVYPNGVIQKVPLEMPSSLEKSGSRLDVISSEWGRMYEHDNLECRLLSPKTGKRIGGHIFIDITTPEDKISEIKVEVKTCSLGKFEDLVLEYINLDTGMWERCEILNKQVGVNNWITTFYKVKIQNLKESDYSELLSKVESSARPPVSISSAKIITSGAEASALVERQPFAVRICLLANESVEKVDVGIKIMRSDGVYVFWQSTGLVGQEINNINRSNEVDFIFSENIFGAGDYALTAYVANQWSFPENYPYSEVYDRKVGCLQFKILAEIPGLDMGLLNQRVNIQISEAADGH